VLQSLEARGRYESARRLRSTIGSVFRYAIATARAEADPTYALRGALTQVKPSRMPRSQMPRNLAFYSAPSMHSTGSLAHGSRFNCLRFCFPAQVNCGWLNGPSSILSERCGQSPHPG
jgi:hypothetical protein